MSTANLAPAVTDEQVSAPVHPLDAGLSLDDWADRDPDGFMAACRNAIDADELIEMAAGMILNPVQPAYCAERWRTRMEKLLAAEVERGPQWIRDWQRASDD